jgi:hypothetical protein
MPSLKELCDQDLEWIISDAGDLVTIISRDGLQRVDEIPAIIHRNVGDPPPYGYEKTLSTKHHEVTFLLGAVGFPILNGVTILFDGQTFTVHSPPLVDGNKVTVYAR